MKMLLAAVFFFALPGTLFSQNYVPFPDSNAVWRQYSSWYDFGCNCAPCSEYQVYIHGETVVNSVVYKNLYWAGVIGPSPPCSQMVFSAGSPYLLIRENANKQVFMLDASGQEHLLYDFNLVAGDTLVWGPFGVELIIVQVDSIQTTVDTRKRYGCKFPNWSQPGLIDLYIIEGIGSTFGLAGMYEPFEREDLLYCFKWQGQDIYPAGQACALVPVGTGEPGNAAAGITISPNPSDGAFSVAAPLNRGSSGKLTVYDLQLLKVLEMPLHPGKTNHFVELPDVADGMFLVLIASDEQIFATRVIVSRAQE
jgi:hypothetical protein